MIARKCQSRGWMMAVTLGVLAGTAHAGGPLVAGLNGRPCVWDKAIPYTMDPGPLGDVSNAQGSQWVAEAFQRWASVEGVQLSVQAAAPYSEDITGDNFFLAY